MGVGSRLGAQDYVEECSEVGEKPNGPNYLLFKKQRGKSMPCGREVPHMGGPKLAAHSSAQLEERHSDDQTVSDNPCDELHTLISNAFTTKTIQPSTDTLMSRGL